MEYFTTTSKPSRRAVDCVVVGVYDRGRLGTAAADIDAASNGELRRLIKSGDISSRIGQCAMLTGVAGVKAPRVAVVGLGKASELDARRYKKAIAAATQAPFCNIQRDTRLAGQEVGQLLMVRLRAEPMRQPHHGPKVNSQEMLHRLHH